MPIHFVHLLHIFSEWFFHFRFVSIIVGALTTSVWHLRKLHKYDADAAIRGTRGFLERLAAALSQNACQRKVSNPASTFPGQQSFRRLAKVSVNVGVLRERLYLPSAQSLRRRSVLVTHAKS